MLDVFKKYFRSLNPMIERSQIRDDLSNMRTEIENTLPLLAAAREFFKTWNFKSKEVDKFNENFQVSVKNRKVNIVVAIADMILSIEKNHSALEKLVNKHFSDDIYKDGLTFVKLNLLRYVEVASFGLRYSRALLIWIYQMESKALDNTQDISLSKGEIKWITNNAQNFFAAYPALNVAKADLERAIGNIPDITVQDDNIDVVSSTVGVSKLDPLKLNFIFGTSFNIAYHIGMVWANWQLDRLNEMKNQTRVIEYRLMHLKNLSNGVQDPKLEENIRYNEERLQALTTKILKFEEEVND
jgi:hypothetical protein